MTSEGRIRLLRGLRITGFWLLGLVLFFGALEAYFRYWHSPSPGLGRFWFMEQSNLDRWQHLEEHRDELVTDDRASESAKRRPNRDYFEEAEDDRPAYDRTPGRYRVVTNEYAFRERSFPKQKAVGTRRVLFLGDSLTFGRGLSPEQRFTDLLQAQAPAGVEILNLGDLGCSLECEQEIFNQFIEFEPDLIVLQASANDIDQSLWREALRNVDTSGLRFKARNWLAHSRAFLAFVYWASGDPNDVEYAEAVVATHAYYGGMTRQIFETCAARKVPIAVLSFPSADDLRYAEHLSRACEQAGGACLGTIEATFSEPTRWLGAGVDTSELTREPQWITDSVDETGFTLDAFTAIFPLRRYFVDMVHPGPLANRLTAAQIAAFLKARWSGWEITAPGPQ